MRAPEISGQGTEALLVLLLTAVSAARLVPAHAVSDEHV